MKILSMTATFGRLENETLQLQGGLHILHAPNEWGKSTWCAFILAMLYGIDTRERTKNGILADKERYAPWSGSAMSGRMDIEWDGRYITIERSSKGRSPMGVFRAYETESGVAVPALTADNCGQTLLGVEKEVFKRAGFLRLSDLPVSQDDALRSRLNALVTTGDESGTADTLANSLRELRNKVRSNRSNGLLPQAEAQRSELESRLQQLRQLQLQCAAIKEEQVHLEEYQNQLVNHAAALEYADSQAYLQRLHTAETDEAAAAQRVADLEAACKTLPAPETLQNDLLRLRQLRDRRDDLHTQAQLLPHEPPAPEIPACFRGLCQEDAVRQAQTDEAVYTRAEQEMKRRSMGILGILLAVAGIPLLLIPHWIGIAACLVCIITGLLLWRVNGVSRRRAAITADALAKKYEPIAPSQWTDAAVRFSAAQTEYTEQVAHCRNVRADLDSRRAELNAQITAFTQGRSLAECEQLWTEARNALSALEEARRDHIRAQELAQTLRTSRRTVLPPQLPDSLTLTREQTQKALADCTEEQQRLQNNLGQCQGRMESEALLRQQLEEVDLRIARLNTTLDALTLAQDTLTQATAELQRRFAPRISQRALELFRKLTGDRYDRLTLDQNFTVYAGARDESTLHEALWRSEGTMDQLYLALRLAVAEELTPEAPLILDDALVRFDDTRLKAAMDILKQEAETKQVILFTCQSRESNM